MVAHFTGNKLNNPRLPIAPNLCGKLEHALLWQDAELPYWNTKVTSGFYMFSLKEVTFEIINFKYFRWCQPIFEEQCYELNILYKDGILLA